MAHTPADKKIDYIEFTTPDIPSIKEFYSKVFGWSFTDWGDEYVSFEKSGVSGGFMKAATIVHGSTLVILYGDDLEALATSIRDAGGTITKEAFSFPGGRRFHFKDPVGNQLAVWSENETTS